MGKRKRKLCFICRKRPVHKRWDATVCWKCWVERYPHPAGYAKRKQKKVGA